MRNTLIALAMCWAAATVGAQETRTLVTKHFRVGLRACYRFVEDVELFTVENRDIGGAAGMIAFKLGGFWELTLRGRSRDVCPRRRRPRR